jgi:predicted GNAT family acetyltransferase
MDNVKLELNENGRGAFIISENGEQLGEMMIGIVGTNLTVYHTEVDPKAEGKGYAKKLLVDMVNYARKNKMTVTALCPYVHAQFKRHADEYADIWNKPQE